MSALGLALIGCVAAGILLTGLPAYIMLLAASVFGAVAGVASGTIPPNLVGALGMRVVNLLENDLLQALPLYLMLGGLMVRLPVADALFRTLASLAPRGPAAPILAGLGLGGLIGPMSGSVGASVLAIARTIAPKLADAGVPAAQRQAVVAVAGTLGVVVPPSLVLILLGDAMLNAHTIAVNATGRTERIINTQDVFRGALMPAGLFFLLAMIAAIAIGGRGAKDAGSKVPRPSRTDLAIALVSLGFLFALLGGVAVGRFYAVEAAASGAFVLFMVAALSGHLRGGQLGRLLAEVMVGTGVLFAPLLAATTFTLVLRLLGTDRLIQDFVAALPGDQVLPVVVILLAIGLSAFALDAFEIIFVVVPLLVPPLLMRTPDAVWVSVLVLLVLQASYLLPPFGYALLLTRGVLKEATGLWQLCRALLPYLAAQLIVLAAVLMMPGMTHAFDPPGSETRKSGQPISREELDKKLREMTTPPPSAPPAGPRF